MKKTRYIILVLLFSICFNAFSQKVKVKKGKIVVDGVEVGIIEVVDKKAIKYLVKDLSGKELFAVDVDIAKGSTRPFEFNWMTITSKDYPQINVVDYSMLSMSLSHSKIIAEILTKTYFIFSSEGVNQDMIGEFFAEKRISKYKEKSTGSGGVDQEGLGEGFEGKIKIKDTEVLFDKVAVANVTNEKTGEYIFTSKSGEEKIVVKYFALFIEQAYDKKWIEVIDSQNRSAEVKMEYLSTWGGLNLKKGITQLLAEKYNILTENGIENLDSFYAVDRIKLSEGYIEEYNTLQGARLENAKNLELRIADFNVNKSGDINTIKDTKHIGRFALGGKEIQNAGGSRNIIALGDIEDKVIAKFEGVNASEYKVTMFDGNAFTFKSKVFNANSNKVDFYQEALEFVIALGYDNVLEYSIRGYLEKENEIAIEEYKARKANSSNIYGKKGYVIDKDGKKWEGDLTIEFEKIVDPSKSQGGNIVSLDGSGDTKYGKEVVIRYKNEKGKTRRKTFNSKNEEVAVILNEDGSETKFEGIKISPDDALDVIATSGSLSFNYSGFYEVISEDSIAKILRNCRYKEFGIKLFKEEKGYFFKGKTKTKRAEKLIKYLSSCSDLPIEIKKLEFSKLSEVETLLKHYKDSCK